MLSEHFYTSPLLGADTNDETTWVVNVGATFHLTLDRKCFSSYIVGDHEFVKMGNPAWIHCAEGVGAQRVGENKLERDWSMLAHAKLSKMFWVEALMITTYVINISPSTPLDVCDKFGETYLCSPVKDAKALVALLSLLCYKTLISWGCS